MPVILRLKGYRFEFFASDGDEPPHIHAKKSRKHAKYWLVPSVTLAFGGRFRPHELNEIRKIMIEHRELFLESWNGFFGR